MVAQIREESRAAGTRERASLIDEFEQLMSAAERAALAAPPEVRSDLGLGGDGDRGGRGTATAAAVSSRRPAFFATRAAVTAAAAAAAVDHGEAYSDDTAAVAAKQQQQREEADRFPKWLHVLKPVKAADETVEWEGKVSAIKKDIRGVETEVAAAMRVEVEELGLKLAGFQDDLEAIKLEIAATVKAQISLAVREELAELRQSIAKISSALKKSR